LDIWRKWRRMGGRRKRNEEKNKKGNVVLVPD
jgi:hypothetical protein